MINNVFDFENKEIFMCLCWGRKCIESEIKPLHNLSKLFSQKPYEYKPFYHKYIYVMVH